ncbi:hypothetical protein K490DRAFT_40487 [Saccharata proteae CBS 121410]|uniref:Serine hydrolase domain-containing protein n=1 Tax=Saccharata proteae CBS 121410 TaxID=1314787 RepID=A0A9P4M0Q3_9PEZI|nr:hypothetical protein K490DRAFT_40487 [Saccharata proteae CBS 121410]
MGSTTAATADATLHLPRILCLHGGGVTAEIFALQSRALIAHLRPSFRLVFADGPFLCAPGPGIHPVYADHGPYRRWLRWLPSHPPIDAGSAIAEMRYQLEDAMEADDRAGATGQWVGFMGFSQGAKLSASLLFEAQRRADEVEEREWRERCGGVDDWRFAVLLAGRAPLAALSEVSEAYPSFVGAGAISEGFFDSEADFKFVDETPKGHRLRLPTLHVHGTADPGLHLHQRLLRQYCEPGTAEVLEWEGAHRVPLKKADVERIVDAWLEVARRAGVEPGKGVVSELRV